MGTQSSDPTHALVTAAIPGVSKLWSETWIKGSLGTLGRFQLRELLGDGGFGQVYQAYDPRLDRDVALKVLKQADPGERVMQRFFREARAAARLEHPNIVPVYDAGRDDGRCWIAYQFVSGRTLLRQRDHQRLDLVDGRPDHPRPGRCARPRAPAGDLPSRPEAGQHPDRRPGAAPPDRLRPGPPRRPRLGPDPRRGRSSGRPPT